MKTDPHLLYYVVNLVIFSSLIFFGVIEMLSSRGKVSRQTGGVQLALLICFAVQFGLSAALIVNLLRSR